MQLKRIAEPTTGRYVLAVYHQQEWVSLADILADLSPLSLDSPATYTADMLRFLGHRPLVA